jgi:cytoskeletal protein CcmA (bactofilin family)
MTDAQSEFSEEEDFDTILAPDIDFSGVLTFEKPFMIRGRLSGEIEAQGLLVVDEDAVVEADIRASRVVIRGSVKGNVTASEKLELARSGRLEGDLSAPDISMESGCVFIGRCDMPKPA